MTDSNSVFKSLCKVVQLMSLALERRKASKTQMREWAQVLRRTADDLERMAQ